MMKLQAGYFPHLLSPVSLQKCESLGECWGKVSNLHCLDIVDRLSELSNIFRGCLQNSCSGITSWDGGMMYNTCTSSGSPFSSVKHSTRGLVSSEKVRTVTKSSSPRVSMMLRTTCFAISFLRPVIEPDLSRRITISYTNSKYLRNYASKVFSKKEVKFSTFWILSKYFLRGTFSKVRFHFRIKLHELKLHKT